MTEHDHKHTYAIEYEYGREVTNRISVWRFRDARVARAFADALPSRREVTNSRNRHVLAALQRVRRGDEWQHPGWASEYGFIGSGVYRLRL